MSESYKLANFERFGDHKCRTVVSSCASESEGPWDPSRGVTSPARRPQGLRLGSLQHEGRDWCLLYVEKHMMFDRLVKTKGQKGVSMVRGS